MFKVKLVSVNNSSLMSKKPETEFLFSSCSGMRCVFGKCSSDGDSCVCFDGYTGKLCNKSIPNIFWMIFWIILLILAILLLAYIIYLLIEVCRNRKSKPYMDDSDDEIEIRKSELGQFGS